MIYLIRHGETEWNRAGRMQGQLDSPLTERGQTQARAVGETLAELTGGGDGLAMVASPLGRTMATATLIAEALGAKDIAADERLMEMSWGDWDGLTHPEIEARSPGELARRKAGRTDHLRRAARVTPSRRCGSPVFSPMWTRNSPWSLSLMAARAGSFVASTAASARTKCLRLSNRRLPSICCAMA